MERWYVLQTPEGKEQETADLLERAADHRLWSICRIPRKRKVFRSGGVLHLVDDVMFHGYLFVRTDCPEALAKELEKSREFPKLVSFEKKEIFIPVEDSDMAFLQDVCGEELQCVMGVSRIILNEDNQIIRADGVLDKYLDRIVKLNLHKRFAVVEIPLFNRVQPVLFGFRLEQDRAV